MKIHVTLILPFS